MRTTRIRAAALGAAVGVLALAGGATAATIDWSAVGGAGNAADDTGFGAVAYDYAIGTYEVTNAQYAEFLNAVAETDTHGLYNASMGSGTGGINQSCAPGCSYSAIAGREDLPVNYVSYYDALRFANWLENGQPSGAQDASTTEDGSYTFTGTASVGGRNGGVGIFLAGEDEWYKAAYFDPGATSYFDSPAGSNLPTACATPGGVPNTANCGNVVGDLSAVGGYTASASPNGSFDQGGNAWEWNDLVLVGQERVVRGGAYNGFGSVGNDARNLALPSFEGANVGFRVVSAVPEPGTGLLVLGGLLALAAQRRLRP